VKQASSAKRRGWFTWHDAHGRNVSATCRRFGIARSTFYRWLRRYDRARPATLRSKSRRPHSVRRPSWSDDDVRQVAEIALAHPRCGRGRIHELLRARGSALSRASVGRILAAVNRVCPICKGRDGLHHQAAHLNDGILAAMNVRLKLYGQPAAGGPLSRSGAVAEAERLIRGSRPRRGSR